MNVEKIEEMDHLEPTETEEIVEEYVVEGTMMMDDIGGETEYIDEDEQVEDEYGGMPSNMYEAIVDFKRTGIYPSMADQRVDRSAHCHWRIRCVRFMLNDDQETLLYFNPNSPIQDVPKFVVKKGEVKSVIDRVHSLIGHLGTKRTQMAIMKKLYWRSVKNDVRTFVNNCAFCNQKKHEGKKLMKAPVDIESDNFDLDVNVRYMGAVRGISIHLGGVDEEYVKQAAMTRMTTYTFRSTGQEHRKIERNVPQYFKRQPYVKRGRYETGPPAGFLLPVANDPMDRNAETTFLEIPHSRMDSLSTMRSNGIGRPQRYMTEEMEDEFGMESTPIPPKKRYGRNSVFPHHSLIRRSNRQLPMKKKCDMDSNVIGAASRLSAALSHNSLHGDSQPGPSREKRPSSSASFILSGRQSGLVSHDVMTSFEEAEKRPEMSLLSPVMLMPSTDPEVVAMQKELLSRQLEVQKLQLRVLQAQYDSIGRTSEGRLEEEEEEEEQRMEPEDVEELNVYS